VVGYGRTENTINSDIPLSIDVEIFSSEHCQERFYSVSNKWMTARLGYVIQNSLLGI